MVGYGLSLVTAPAAEPLTIHETQRHCRIADSVTRWNTLLSSLIVSARQYAESATDRKLVTQTWDLFLDGFPCYGEPIYIPFGKCQSAVVTYTDTAGATQTWDSADYVLSTSREPAVIRPTIGESYPTPQNKPDAVKVRFVCGYGSPDSVPKELKSAMLLIVDHLFRNTSTEVVGTITSPLKIGADMIFQHYKLGDEFTNYGALSTYGVTA